MKLIDNIVFTQVADEYIAVPVGDATHKFMGVIRLNKTGKDILEALAVGKDEETIANNLLDKYDGVDKKTAMDCINEIVKRLDEAGLIDNGEREKK